MNKKKGFYILLVFNILQIGLLVLFIIQRGGYEYIQAKYEQVVNSEKIHSNLILFKKYKINSQLNGVKKNDILVIGDSITEYGRWAELLDKHNVKNCGIGGETSTGLKGWYLPLLEKKPSEIILLIGINNFKSGISDPKLNQYFKDINYFCSQTPPTIRLYLVSILPINEQMAKNFIHCTNNEIKKINMELEKIAKEFEHVTYVDVFDSLPKDTLGQLLPTMTLDGVHLNYNGYIEYSKVINSDVSKF